MARWFSRAFAGAVVALTVLVGSHFAGAKGYYNLPVNSWQWWGHGFSGGYHAPFVLGPIAQNSHQWPNVYRQPYAPNPYACAAYCGGCGHEMNAVNLEEPTRLPPSQGPAAEPAPPQPTGAMPEAPSRSSMLVRPVKY